MSRSGEVQLCGNVKTPQAITPDGAMTGYLPWTPGSLSCQYHLSKNLHEFDFPFRFLRVYPELYWERALRSRSFNLPPCRVTELTFRDFSALAQFSSISLKWLEARVVKCFANAHSWDGDEKTYLDSPVDFCTPWIANKGGCEPYARRIVYLHMHVLVCLYMRACMCLCGPNVCIYACMRVFVGAYARMYAYM